MTLVESLLSILLAGLLVLGVLAGVRSAIVASRSHKNTSKLERGLAAGADQLDQATYVRCPVLDPTHSYQDALDAAAAQLGWPAGSIVITAISYWDPQTGDVAGPTTTSTTTTTTTTIAVTTTTTIPATTTTVPASTTSTTSPPTTQPTTTTTEPATTTTDPVGGGGAGTTTTAVVVTNPPATTTTTPPTTEPLVIGLLGPSASRRLGDASRLARSTAGFVRRAGAIDCSNPVAGDGPLQRITLRATSPDGTSRTLQVVKSNGI